MGVDWTVPLADIRDTDPASLVTSDGLVVRVQLLSAQGYPPWPTAIHDIDQRYSDIARTRLRTPVRDSFAAWKTAAWFERHAPRDLYDLWALALAGALTRSAGQLFATHTGLGPPQDHMFSRVPAERDWQEQLSGQTRCRHRECRRPGLVRRSPTTRGRTEPANPNRTRGID
jgi:hypothetical protein